MQLNISSLAGIEHDIILKCSNELFCFRTNQQAQNLSRLPLDAMTNTGANQQQYLQLIFFTFTSNISVNLLHQDFRDGKVNVNPGGISSAPRSRRSSRGSSYQRSRGTRDLVQPWLARLRLVNCMLAMPNLCSEDPQWYLERQQPIPADKQPASQGQRWVRVYVWDLDKLCLLLPLFRTFVRITT